MYYITGFRMPQFTNFWSGSLWHIYSSNATGPNLYIQNYYTDVGYLLSGYYSNINSNYSTQIWTHDYDASNTWLIHSVSNGLWTLQSAKTGYYVRFCDQVEGMLVPICLFFQLHLCDSVSHIVECYQSFGSYPIMVAPAQFDVTDRRFLFEIYEASTRDPIVAYSSCQSMLAQWFVI
jgi:hypothetical protein